MKKFTIILVLILLFLIVGCNTNNKSVSPTPEISCGYKYKIEINDGWHYNTYYAQSFIKKDKEIDLLGIYPYPGEDHYLCKNIILFLSNNDKVKITEGWQ